MALNLSVAVQAKDYEDKVPLRRLATFHLLVTAQGSPLRDKAGLLMLSKSASATCGLERWRKEVSPFVLVGFVLLLTLLIGPVTTMVF